MKGSIANGLNLVHHYLNTSFSREFRCDESVRIETRDITVKWMYTNLRPDNKEIRMKRLGENKTLGREQEFLDWWPILREPHGFHIIYHAHFFHTCLTVWKKEEDAVEVEKIALYGDDGADAIAYCESIGKVMATADKEAWDAYSKHNAELRLTRKNNVIPIWSSM